MTKDPPQPHWNTVAIYGVGLIGGSIGMALRERNLADRVVGIGRNPDRLSQAVSLGAIDEFATEPADAPTPDIVILCTPVQKLVEHCQDIATHHPAAFITDAGSTKENLVSQIEQSASSARFVGSHPLAGSDKSGVQHSTADLYVDRLVILTPTDKTDAAVTETIAEFWQAVGARTIAMSPTDHDEALAITSHVPHVVAAALATSTPEQFLNLVAGGWRDTTRIAAADVELWTQILQENNKNVLSHLQNVRSKIQEFESALTDNNRDSLNRLLAVGKQRRDALGS